MRTTHELAAEVLAPYVDGALPLAEAAAVRAHLSECAACSADVRSLQQLNRDLELPAAPPVSFHAFWAGIEKSLPRRRPLGRVRVVRRSLALAFALAALLVLATAASAFASDRILPDSPVYALKRVGEDVRLDLAGSRSARVRLELQLAGERLREAQVMARERKNGAALTSLRSFQSLLEDASPSLQRPEAAERPEMEQAIGELSQELGGVEQAIAQQPDESDVQAEAIVEDAQADLVQDQQLEQESGNPEATPQSSIPGGATD